MFILDRRVHFGWVGFVLYGLSSFWMGFVSDEFLFWTGRVCFGQAEFVCDRPSLFWTGRICFG